MEVVFKIEKKMRIKGTAIPEKDIKQHKIAPGVRAWPC
jgi:hypothetical protein